MSLLPLTWVGPATAVVAAVGLMTLACARESGEPRAVTPSTPTSTPSSLDTAVSIGDLDLCELLRPTDLPIQPGPDGRTEQEPELDGERCANSVQLANPFNLMVSGVQRRRVPFDNYEPVNGSSGQFIEIAGRRAWVGRITSDPKACLATFGAADGALTVTLTDETHRGVDPCRTVTEIASTVISRSPPPTEQ